MFDRTYCGSENCEDKCGRKMPQTTQQIISQYFPWRPISYTLFCNDKGEPLYPEYTKKDEDL